MPMVKVARMPKTVDYGGKKYGPSDGPLEMPLELAVALGLTPLEGEVVAAASDTQSQELAAAQSLAGQYQRNLELLLDQLRPHVRADVGETPDQTLARLLRERDNLRGSLDSLKQENENNVRTMNSVGLQVTDLQNQLAAVVKERDDARQALADAKLLPDDALARLEGVSGISKALAQKGLDALTAPAGK